MKKLLIAACAVAFASVTQAASVTWGATDDTICQPGTMDAVTDGLAAYVIASTSFSQDNFISSYNANSGNQAATIAAAGAAVAGTDSTMYGWLFGGDITADIGANYYIAVFDSDIVFVSELSAVEVNPLNPAQGTLNWLDMSASQGPVAMGSFGGAGWYQATPEPTSGMMLLLGVGLMALRRRRV